jgi:MFS family permease
MSISSTEKANGSYPKPVIAWVMVVMLTLAYILSFVDRFILGLLIEPIKADLSLSDTQIGLLLGPAFAIFYATMGIPLGWAADRVRRVWILAAGVLVWSLATAASGLARNFGHLFLARMSVGVGEATLSPCAMSMISDSFPPEKRGQPIAFYSAAIGLGAGMANLLGAAVLTWVKSDADVAVPIVGDVSAWQLTFLILGIPGVFFAFLFLFIREPERQQTGENLVVGRQANPLDMLGYVGRNWKLFLSFMPIFCFLTITAYSQGWLAPMFQRTWGWSPRDYALVNGLSLLLLGPISINVAGWLSDRWYAQGRYDAPLVVAMIGLVIIVPTSILAPLMPNGVQAFVLLGINMIGLTWLSATGVTALINIVPADIRGQIVAFYYMVISVTGLFLGPTTVGLLTDNVFGAEGLRYAMVMVPVLFGVPLLFLLPLTRRIYRRAYIDVNGQPEG